MAGLKHGIAAAWLLAAPFAATPAQEAGVEAEAEADLTLPPVIESAPGEARLEPPEEDREDMLEAVVTSGQTDWRLPDLGTSLREEAPELEPDQRIAVEFVPLYDPESGEPELDLTPNPEVMRGVGFLKFIEVRFGQRSPD